MLRGDKWRKDERPDAATAATDGEKSVKIGAPKEIFDGENRVAMTPDSAAALVKLGHTCVVQAGAGPPPRSRLPVRKAPLPPKQDDLFG